MADQVYEIESTSPNLTAAACRAVLREGACSTAFSRISPAWARVVHRNLLPPQGLLLQVALANQWVRRRERAVVLMDPQGNLPRESEMPSQRRMARQQNCP